MKLVLLAMTLTLSAQTFANCTLPEKQKFISAEKISCDEELGQVLLEGIKVKKFDQEKNVLINGSTTERLVKTADNICETFGLKSAEEVTAKTIYSYLTSGVLIDIDPGTGKFKLYEVKQTNYLAPVKSIICNR